MRLRILAAAAGAAAMTAALPATSSAMPPPPVPGEYWTIVCSDGNEYYTSVPYRKSLYYNGIQWCGRYDAHVAQIIPPQRAE